MRPSRTHCPHRLARIFLVVIVVVGGAVFAITSNRVATFFAADVVALMFALLFLFFVDLRFDRGENWGFLTKVV